MPRLDSNCSGKLFPLTTSNETRRGMATMAILPVASSNEGRVRSTTAFFSELGRSTHEGLSSGSND